MDQFRASEEHAIVNRRIDVAKRAKRIAEATRLHVILLSP